MLFSKNISNKSWVVTLVTILISILLFNSVFLYITDTYSITNTNPKECYSVPNQKYLITEYLLRNKDRYDTFIFGSSKVASINPFMLKNKKAYNMTYGEGIPREHLLILKLLIKNNIKIEHLIIALDDFSYAVSYQNHQQSFIPKSHYLATSTSIVDFYQFYFFRKPRSSDIKHFKKKYLNTTYNRKLINSVCKVIFTQDKTYPKSATKYAGTKTTSSSNYILNTANTNNLFKDKICFNNTLNDISEIVKLTKKYNIKTIFTINPIKYTTYSYIDRALLMEFKEQLSYITPYYDFSLPNQINNDENNWIDGLHYNKYVGDLIINRIYDNNTSIKDFGVYIEKKEKN